MESAPFPPDETTRLAALHRLEILDTPTEERFERITRTASRYFGVPITLITLVDADRQWFKAHYGLDLQQTPRSESFCAHTILQNDVLHIPDARLDPRFADNPFVLGAPFIRFYAGKVLYASDGSALGTLCLISPEPRDFTDEERIALTDMAAWAEYEMNRAELARAVRDHAISEQRYRAFAAALPDAIVRLNADGTLLDYKPGVDGPGPLPAGLPGEHFSILTYPEEYQAVMGIVQEVIRTGQMHVAEWQRGSHDFESRTVASGTDEVLIILRDITNRKQTERALRASEANYRRLALNLPRTAVLLYDHELRYLLCEGSVLADYGLKREAMEGRTMQEALPPMLAERLEPHYQSALRGETVSIESALPGGAAWYLHFSPMRDENDAIVGGMVLVQDVSERYKSEEALRQARDQALEASRLKSEFLANMSHEIRTPMNGVIGMTDLLLQTSMDTQQRELVETIHSSGQALLAIINDILDFSKIEAGKVTLERIDVELIPLVENAAELLGPQARAKGISLMTYIDPALPSRMKGDPLRIQQVLLNLISNAVKFTAQGEVVATVTLERGASGAAVRFSVRDTGIGLSEVARKRLFSPFTQADGSTTRKYGGTGLGLAICKRLIELMGGEIGVESVEGQGATFWFTVPMPEYEEHVYTLDTAALPRLRILIVSDNLTTRTILHDYIRSWYMQPTAVNSLTEMFEHLQSGEAYEVLLLDVSQSEAERVATLHALDLDPLLRDLRVILLDVSASTQPPRAETELKLQIVHLLKPARQSQIYNAIMSVIEGMANYRAKAQSTNPETPLPHPTARPMQGGRILLVEDNPINQQVALRQLQQLGFRADLASNGLEAVEAARRTHYAMILMDCQMPEMDGFQATEQIRLLEASEATASSARAVIIAMTANAMEGDRETCLRYGMDDYIAKPVTLERLRAVLNRWVKVAEPMTLDPMAFGKLFDLFIGDPPMLVSLIDDFVSNSARMITDMRSALNDMPTLRHLAHTLKGGALSFGAMRLAELCRVLEKQAGSGHVPDALTQVERVEVEYGSVKIALMAEREKVVVV